MPCCHAGIQMSAHGRSLFCTSNVFTMRTRRPHSTLLIPHRRKMSEANIGSFWSRWCTSCPSLTPNKLPRTGGVQVWYEGFLRSVTLTTLTPKGEFSAPVRRSLWCWGGSRKQHAWHNICTWSSRKFRESFTFFFRNNFIRSRIKEFWSTILYITFNLSLEMIPSGTCECRWSPAVAWCLCGGDYIIWFGW
jgi:hypothetical protein